MPVEDIDDECGSGANMFKHRVAMNWERYTNKSVWSLGTMITLFVGLLLIFIVGFYFNKVVTHQDLKVAVEETTKGPSEWEDPVFIDEEKIGMYIGITGPWISNQTKNWLQIGSYNKSAKEIPMPYELDWYFKECTFEEDFSRYLSNYYVKTPSPSLQKGLEKIANTSNMYCIPQGKNFELTKTKGPLFTVMQNKIDCNGSRLYNLTKTEAQIKFRIYSYIHD